MLDISQGGVMARQSRFYDEQDYKVYLDNLKASAEKYAVRIHAFVLMTNHVHLLVTPNDDKGVARMMQALGRKYPNVYELVGVPGRTKILIHSGNFHTDTLGCLCPGKSYGPDGTGNFRTFSSVAARNKIFSIIKKSSSASIIITNDFERK